MDPNSLNLNPDPEFCLHLDPDPDPGLCYQLCKNSFREKLFSFKTILSVKNKEIMAPKELFILLSL